MTTAQRVLAAALSGALALAGFVFGRATTPTSTQAEAERAASAFNQPTSTTPATAETSGEQAFYLSDYQTGYNAGYQSGLNGQAQLANTARAGYNEGFKGGYADGYQARQEPQANSAANRYQTVPIVNRTVTRSYARPVYYKNQPRRSNSKLKTALTIAAPAAIGAGIGAAAGGKKGAGVGALLGGGGGALYHLIKNRNRD